MQNKITAEVAISKMIPPGKKRPGIWRNGVLQILITRACDRSCFHCTQNSQLKGKPEFISAEHFELALKSLGFGGKDPYFGVVGMFGGNPALHPQFNLLCEILRHYVPFEQRGIWCNHPKSNGPTMRYTFNPAVSNLNVHQSQEAYDAFVRDWPECTSVVKGLDSDSRHGPPFVAMQDVIASEAERWELISNCDVNRHWSAIICTFRGELRAFFCELAGAQAVLHQHSENYNATGLPYPDTGLPVVDGWWRKPIQDFSEQIKFHCHSCGIPLKGYGSLANSGPTEQISKTHQDAMRPKDSSRKMQLMDDLVQLGAGFLPKATNYIENGSI